jgi:hypothetical protein
VKVTSHLHSVLRTIGATPLNGTISLFSLNIEYIFSHRAIYICCCQYWNLVTECVVSTFVVGCTVADSNCCSSATVSPYHQWPKRAHSYPKAGKRSEFWWKLQIQVNLNLWLRNDHLQFTTNHL